MREASTCLSSFLLSFTVHIFIFYFSNHSFISSLIIPFVVTPLLFVSLQKSTFQISIRASFLGYVFGLGAIVSCFFSSIWMFGVYLMFIINFHMTEYLFIALFSSHSLSTDSFILNHSPAYFVATFSSWIEFFLEYWLLPGLKEYSILVFVGILLCILGEGIRKAAIATAGTSFSHLVEENKRAHHKLITHGIFSICRHPSYLGWWVFAVGTQFILVNPVCAVGYCLVSWNMFSRRIPHEEFYLLHFFGEDYAQYQKRVPTGLPFISGCTDGD